nr:immunoglobulin light chain junction region [Macaca mulatta]
YIQTLEFPWTF